jgi:hypothetical protein
MIRRILSLLIVTASFPSLLNAQCPVTSLMWPLPGPFDPNHPGLKFGAPWIKSCGGEIKIHTGRDYTTDPGTPVVAAASGTVVVAQLDTVNIGWVTIDHGCFTTVNLHLIPTVRVNDWVNAGDLIGHTGMFTDGTVPHLHFGIRETPYANSNTANRGALPQHPCANDPQFPEHFIDPETVQYYIPSGTGTIQLNATLDGAPWPSPPSTGALNWQLNGANSLSGGSVPATLTGQRLGGYTPYYLSGGPTGASPTSITPASSQMLTAGGVIGWTFNFTSGVCGASGGGVSANCTPALSVALTANPTSGTVPLTGVTLSASVTGSAQQTINYTFYCDRQDTGVNITFPYDWKVDGTYTNPLTVSGLCNYLSAGIKYAKVIAEQGAGQVQSQVQINVGQVAPTCYSLTLSRNPSSGGGLPTASPANSSICGAGQYVASENVQLTAYPANGFGVGSWVGTANDASTSTTNSLVMPASNQTVTVDYVQSQQNGKPTVTTGGVDGITTTSAMLHGTVNPNGLQTTAFFEYGVNVNVSVTSTAAQSMGSGTSPLSFAEPATGLTCGTTYTYYATAGNSAGASAGQWQTFSTLSCQTSSAPTVSSESADGITQTSAVLHAWVNPNGLQTTANFQYGTSPASATATPPQSIGYLAGLVQINWAIGGLSCGTTYSYNATAANSAGPASGPWQTFTTASCPTSSAPTVTSEGIQEITGNSAVLFATVSPNGLPTTAYFQYGMNPTVSVNGTPPQSIPSSVSSAPIAAPISSLDCNTSYTFYAIGSSTAGATPGTFHTFRTSPCDALAPFVTSESVDSITQRSAGLHGAAIPNGLDTYVYFVYGMNQSTSLGYAPASNLYIGNGTDAVPFATAAIYLSCGTTYFYYAVAFNAGSATGGNVQSFTTSPCDLPPPQIITGGVDGITQYAVSLHGVVNPYGSDTGAWFEYGPDPNYDHASWYLAVGHGTAPLTYTSLIRDPLQCGTLYHYRAVASNGSTTVYGQDMTFTTAPCNPAAGSFFYTVPPCRLIDTRPPSDPNGPAIAAGATRTLQFVGGCGIRALATAVSLNVTVVGPATDGFLVLAPTAGGTTSTINFRQGQVRANNAVVPLNPDGTMTVFCGMGFGAVDYIIDVNGYFQQ